MNINLGEIVQQMPASELPIPIFIGFDERQPLSYTALCQSIIDHSSKPVAITPLVLKTLPITRQGLTPFTYSRFLVPWLMNYLGWAIFLDLDILLNGDIAELWALRDTKKAAMVVKHEGHLQFERASVMLLDCQKCGILTPKYIEEAKKLHDLSFLPDHLIGALPHEWNHLVGYDRPRSDAKLLHFTQGIPAFPETKNSDYAAEWMSTAQRAVSSQTWRELMGNSVHARPVIERLTQKGT